MHERPRVSVKVERGSTLTFMRDLPYNVSILFTRVKFMCVRTEKLRDNRNPPFRRLSRALSVAIGTYRDDGGFVEHFFLSTKT